MSIHEVSGKLIGRQCRRAVLLSAARVERKYLGSSMHTRSTGEYAGVSGASYRQGGV